MSMMETLDRLDQSLRAKLTGNCIALHLSFNVYVNKDTLADPGAQISLQRANWRYGDTDRFVSNQNKVVWLLTAAYEDTGKRAYHVQAASSLPLLLGSPTLTLTQLEELEASFRALLKGENSHLSLTLNPHLLYGLSVQTYLDQSAGDLTLASPEEQLARKGFDSQSQLDQAIERHSFWELQWYPETPEAFCQVRAAHLKSFTDYTEKAEDDVDAIQDVEFIETPR